MSWARGWSRKWVQLWDERETAESLALVRIFLPLVILYDLFDVWRLGLVTALWAPIEEGGFGPACYYDPVIWFYKYFGPSIESMHMLIAITIGSAVALCLGLFSRTSALILLLSYAQFEALSPDADRGIDTLMRNALAILVLSRAGATLSLDARLWQGSFVSDRRYPAWPRYLLILQLSILYFFAGMAKDSANWSWSTGYVALFYVLHQPHHARWLLPHEWLVAAYPLIQVGALTTVLWERSAIALPLLKWLRRTQGHASKLHHWVNRLRLLEVWVATGVFFHLMLALLLALGIFPWGCLALYPCLARPETIVAWASSVRGFYARRLLPAT